MAIFLAVCIFISHTATLHAFSFQQALPHIAAKSSQLCTTNDPDNTPSPLFTSEMNRRSALFNAAACATTAAASMILQTQPALAKEIVPIGASWTAVAGLNTNDNTFVQFDSKAYQAMVMDPARTPFFEKAIIKRLRSAPGGPESQVVLDLGTGPVAVFAIIAAQNGAGKVYAIEANSEAARSARATVTKAGFDDIITVIEGFSTDTTLPNNVKADFCVAEIIGSVVSEEGAYATILDAHRRLIKEPNMAENWIPSRIQTYGAPASYSLHNLFQPPAFDWDKLQGEPVRFNCKDEGLQLLSDPQILEDIRFWDIESCGFQKKELRFTVDPNRIEDNTPAFFNEFRLGRLENSEAEKMSIQTARSFSGIAMWPRLLLDADGSIEVNSRSYPDGNHQRSHWQTVLPIMNALPVTVQGGDEVVVTVDFDIPVIVKGEKPPSYKLAGNII